MVYNALLVDDEYMILSGLQKIIDWSEYHIEIVGTAANGQAALEFLENQSVDIVITDVTMPIMSGIEFVKEAKRRKHDFHFIVLSGYEEFDYVRESLVLGAENYLLKPINKEELSHNLKCITEKLAAEVVKAEKEQLFFMSVLEKWLTGELEQVELARWLEEWGYQKQGNYYQVLIVTGESQVKESLKTIFKEYQQPLLLVKDEELILIFNGSLQQSQLMLRKIREELNGSSLDLALGEIVQGSSQVPSSYEHAQDFLALINFYQKDEELASQIKADNSQLVSQGFAYSFTEFQEVLALGQLTDIKKEINHLFKEMSQAGLAPQNVTPIIFFILTDVFRRFKQEEALDHQGLLAEIDQEVDFHGLKKLVHQKLSSLENDQQRVALSSNVQKVLEIIHQEVQKDLSLKEVSERLHLNAMYLGQLFKKEMGVSFSKYLNEYRITKAKELLTHSELNINEISAQVGYTSSGYFYKTFKKMTGQSPKEYRQI